MGLCARAQVLERHERTEQSATAVSGAPRESCTKGIARAFGYQESAAGTVIATHPPLTRFDRGAGRCIPKSRCAYEGMSECGPRSWMGDLGGECAAASERRWPLGEISYMKGNLRSEISFYFKSELSGPS